MIHSFKIIIFIFLVSLLSSCGQSKLLKQVDDIAIVSVQFDRTISVVTKEEFENGDIQHSTTPDFFRGKTKFLEKLSYKSDKEKEYFNNFAVKIENKLLSSPLNLVPVSSFSTDPNYTAEHKAGKYSDLTFYVPEPYSNPNLWAMALSKKNKHKDGSSIAIRLTDSLDVDAVAAFKLKFVQIKPNNALIGTKQMAAIGNFIIRNNKGKTIINKTIKVKSKKNYGLNFDTGVVLFNEKTKAQFENLEGIFFEEINKTIDRALKKK